MDNSFPELVGDAGKWPPASLERVDERASPVAGSRMDNHATRLVDNEQIVVLEDDVERNILTDDFAVRRRGDGNSDLFPGPGAVACLFPAAIDRHLPGRNQRRCLVSRELEVGGN